MPASMHAKNKCLVKERITFFNVTASDSANYKNFSSVLFFFILLQRDICTAAVAG